MWETKADYNIGYADMQCVHNYIKPNIVFFPYMHRKKESKEIN